MQTNERPLRVLGIFAHPDDADCGSGATLSRLAGEGADVRIVVVTSGDQGGYRDEGQSEIASVRHREQRESAAVLGISEVHFLEGYGDGHVEVTHDLVRDLSREIRDFRPDLVITMSPYHNFSRVKDSHPDHRATGEAALRAVYPASRNRFAYPELLREGYEEWIVPEVWLQGHEARNHFVPLTDKEMDTKIAALRCHASQFADMERMERQFRGEALEAARKAGLVHGTYAEGFFRYPTDE